MIKLYNKSILVALALLSSTSLNAENIVDSIMKLRTDVEGLYTTIDENKENYKSQMKSIAMQVADTEAQIGRKETTLKLNNLELEKTNDKLAKLGSSAQDYKPLLNDAIVKLETLIKTGIPFKVDERLASLAKIKTDLKEGTITQEKALSLVWASYDDALRITKEIGLFKQNIELNGEPKMAKIAKLGSIALYFATPDNQVGYVVKEGNGYKYKVEEEGDGIKKIVALFDALQKQIRTGYFSVPNALVLSEAK
ncbi:MAG: DUF3450 family protein [Campylobacterales bacterium]|nr:DUF3450 family protein [Campylobacterales bacterium]